MKESTSSGKYAIKPAGYRERKNKNTKKSLVHAVKNPPAFSHVDQDGKAKMVDISPKETVKRYALAEGHIELSRETCRMIQENLVKKGDVLAIAKIAGIMGAKRTQELIPLCHTITLESIDIKTDLREFSIYIQCEVRCSGKTGVEMEALTGVSVALLTVYDMCKAIDKNMKIGPIQLVEKTKEKIID